MASLSGSDLLSERRLDCEKLRVVQECYLNSCLWGRLPESLVEEILAKLPFSSLARMCRVHKKWRDLIFFCDTFPRRFSRHCRLVFSSNEKLEVYSSSPSMRAITRLQFVQQSMLHDVIASAAGIFCFRNSPAGGSIKFIVCNPVTKCYKTVQMLYREASAIDDQPFMPSPPPGSDDSSCFPSESLLTGVVVDSDTGHFKIIVAAVFEESRGTTLVYDSSTDSWRKKVAPVLGPDGPRIPCWHRNYLKKKPHPVECGNKLYFHLELGAYLDRLLKYEVEHETWSWISMPARTMVGVGVRDPWNVIEHNGKIVLVTSTHRLRDTGINRDQTFWAWELQEEGPTWWLPLNQSPFSTIRELVPDIAGIECLGRGDVVFLIRRRGSWFTSGSPGSCNCRAESLSCHCKDVGVGFHQAKKTSVREFRRTSNNLYIVSSWEESGEEYNGDLDEPLPLRHIFTPSTLLLK